MLSKRAILYGVSAAAFLGPFTQTIYTPSLLEMKAFFGVSTILINLTISLFTIILATSNFVIGPIADTKGRRAVLLPGLLLFIGGSLICLLSKDYALFLTGRILQAAGVGTGQVVAAAVIADIYQPAERGHAMGTYQTLIYLGPVLGPVFGGLISAYFHWQWAFAVLIVFGVVTFFYNHSTLVETLPKDTKPRRITTKTFKDILSYKPAFAIILLGFSQFYGYYIFLVFLPSMLSNLFHVSAVSEGFFFLPLTAAILVGTIIGSRMQKKWRKTKIVVWTSFGIGVNVALLWATLATGILSLPALEIFLSIYGLLLGCSLPSQSAILVNLFKEQKATAVGIYNFLRFTGASLGPVIGGLVVEWYGNRGLFASLGILILIASVLIRKYIYDPYEVVHERTA
jgi:MFS transporter, DHA1 family, multidrug resistance protein